MARQAKATKWYVDADGNKKRSAFSDYDHLLFEFANGETREYKPEDFPQEIRVCAEAHGYMAKFGDAYSGAKSVQEALDKHDDCVAQVLEGDWVTAAEEGGAPRKTQLVEAYIAAKAKRGVEITEADAIETVKGWDSDKRKEIAEIPEIALELAEIRLRQARERAEKAAEKVAGSEGAGLDDI